MAKRKKQAAGEVKKMELRVFSCPECKAKNIKHPYQDATYGNGVRVYNPCKDGFCKRCTVCGFTLVTRPV